jgi:hypothetical protein
MNTFTPLGIGLYIIGNILIYKEWYRVIETED